MNCTLCNGARVKLFKKIKYKNYYKCADCDLVFLDKKHYLNIDEEKIRYDFHQNNIEDKAYVEFLNRVIKPTKSFIQNDDIGLDFGCGPNPVLAKLIENSGNNCDFYDPIYFPNLPEKKYNFIFATECFEHFYSSNNELKKILNLLSPNGILAIMTELNNKSEKFSDWYYIKDPTHVCFYSENTVEFICKTFGFELIYSDKKRVFVLKKK